VGKGASRGSGGKKKKKTAKKKITSPSGNKEKGNFINTLLCRDREKAPWNGRGAQTEAADPQLEEAAASCGKEICTVKKFASTKRFFEKAFSQNDASTNSPPEKREELKPPKERGRGAIKKKSPYWHGETGRLRSPKKGPSHIAKGSSESKTPRKTPVGKEFLSLKIRGPLIKKQRKKQRVT